MPDLEFLLASFGPVLSHSRRSPARSVVTGDEWVIVAGFFLTTPLGLINSPRLLEHQVTANRGPDAAKTGPTAATLPQFQFRTSGAHSWVFKKKRVKPTVLETLHLHLPCTLSPNLLLAEEKKHGMRSFFFSFFSFTRCNYVCLPKAPGCCYKVWAFIFLNQKSFCSWKAQHFHYSCPPSLPTQPLRRRRCLMRPPHSLPRLPAPAHVFIFSSPPAVLLL